MIGNNIIPLFSCPVYHIHDTEYRCNDEEKNCLLDSSLTSNNSSDNYLSADKYILNKEKLSNLKRLCQTHLDEYTSNVLKIQQNFKITNSWVSVKKENQLHHFHNHPNSIFSGVFYVNVCDGEIQMQGNPGILNHYHFDYTYNEWNIFNSSTWRVPVTTGSIILFPSHIQHGVPPNISQEDRIIVGFNSFVSGKLSDFGYCTDLTIDCQ